MPFRKVGLVASLLGAQQNRDSVENKPNSLLVVSFGKTLNRMPPSLCQTDGGPKQSIRRGGPSVTADLQTEREL